MIQTRHFILFFVAMLAGSPAAAAERAFLMVDTANVDVSEAWYKTVFDLSRVNRSDQPKAEVRILKGPDMLVEIAQMKPVSPNLPASRLGIRKAGVQVANFDRKLVTWRSIGIAKSKVIFDEAIGLATTLLYDPDGNIVQVFGKSSGPFDAVIKVNLEFSRQ